MKQADAQKFLKWDQNIKTTNLRKILNQSVPTKGKTYKGGMQAYVKNMMEVGKITKYIKGVGHLGIFVDVINGGVEVEVYNATPEEKTRTTVVEGTKIGVGIATGGTGWLLLVLWLYLL